MKIDFSLIIFIDETQVTFDGPDGWVKGWILSNSHMPVAKRRQEVGGCAMILTEIVNQTIIGPFRINKRVKLNHSNYYNFMDK